jgi:hypothetical protein
MRTPIVLLALALTVPAVHADTRRNLFAYVEDETRPPQKKTAAAVIAQPIAIQAPATGVDVVEEQLTTFEFPFRYAGSFGPDANPIAVLIGDGVLTVRAGDTIGGAFVVRRVGLESLLISRGEIVRRFPLN